MKKLKGKGQRRKELKTKCQLRVIEKYKYRNETLNDMQALVKMFEDRKEGLSS